MKSVRLPMLFSLLVVCFAFAAVGAGASWADGGSQLIDVSHQVSDLQTQIASAQQHNQAFKTGQLTASESCGFGAASQVFGQFGDNGYYALPSKGDLADWSLNNVGISGNHDPYSQAQYSLTLAGNAQVTTATYCVGVSNNVVRLFLQDSGPSNADLKVNLLYEGTDGNVQNVTIAKLQGSSTWQPSIAIPLAISALASSYPGGLMPVAFQFQPEGLGNGQTWSLDGLSFAQPAPGPIVPTPTASSSFQTAITPATTTQPSSSAPVTQASTSTVAARRTRVSLSMTATRSPTSRTRSPSSRPARPPSRAASASTRPAATRPPRRCSSPGATPPSTPSQHRAPSAAGASRTSRSAPTTTPTPPATTRSA